MKKFLLSIAFVVGIATSAFSQFSEQGYKNIKIGMSADDFLKLYSVNIGDDDISVVEIDGVELRIRFGTSFNEEVYSIERIECGDAKTKLVGVYVPVIGTPINNLVNNLGNKLRKFPMSDDLYYYYATPSSKDSDKVCMLEVGEDGKVHNVFTTYHQ